MSEYHPDGWVVLKIIAPNEAMEGIEDPEKAAVEFML